MPLPAMLTFNELDGLEVREILENRIEQIFNGVTQFQKHLTLPRVRMTLDVKLEVWADQPNPDVISIGDRLTVVVENPPETYTAQTVDSAAPGPGGNPPDKLREQHGLAISKPDRGDRNIGAHFTYVDHERQVEDQRPKLPGVEIRREGPVTAIVIDQGPAGLQHGMMQRESLRFGRPKS